ncbi:MAG: radical SAM protein [Deltaproteobacteria bacterium]|nr:radical SAM protein [Deltaproteobacteria bacterium]
MGVAAGRQDASDLDAQVIEAHEGAAHQKRNWVRLTYDCNDNCTFCLDSDTHDGEIRSPEEIKRQILDGKKLGAERLILSGGEPTIHPRFVDFVRLGALAGYDRVQTVTNGRMFRYRPFLTAAIDAGLGEITFSIHGPNAKIHDALVGVKGAFEQELEGLQNALDDGRVILNIDVCVNRGNVKHLDALIEKFVGMGVREYDLLHVIPFGRAYTEGRDTLFYDLDASREHLVRAFEWSKKPDMHIWLNRFPVRHLEGYESLIQDPHKLEDEIRGRKEEFASWIDHGLPLDCREPTRCGYCYLEEVCDTFEGMLADVAELRDVRAIRFDTEWDARQKPVFGGDPASARRTRVDAAAGDKTHLPLLGQPGRAIEHRTRPELARLSGAPRLVLVAPDVERARGVLADFSAQPELCLELDSYADLDADALGGKRLVSCLARNVAQAEELLALEGDFEVLVLLTQATQAWLLEREDVERLALRQPTWEKLTESRDHDVDLRAFFDDFAHAPPVEGVPACVLGRAPRDPGKVLDLAMLSEDGRPEPFRYIARYIARHYRALSLRCEACMHRDGCEGLHVNYVRAHGFSAMEPVTDGDGAP